MCFKKVIFSIMNYYNIVDDNLSRRNTSHTAKVCILSLITVSI